VPTKNTNGTAVTPLSGYTPRAGRISMSERANRGLRIAGILFCLLLVVFAKFHEQTRFVHSLQKLAHPVTFGAVALLFLTLLRPRTPRLLGHYIAAFVLTVLCGAGTEIAQAFVDRDPSFLDVLRDALGATTALAAFATLTQPQKASRWSGRRVLGATLTIVGFVVMVTPVSISLAAYARRDLRFPVLLEACSPLDRYFLQDGGAEATIVPSPGATTSACGRALRVELTAASYDGIHLEEPYPDWREAHSLVLDLRNPGEADLPLGLRVHDRAHNLQFRDRFYRGFILHAHERLEVTVSISEIEHAPAGRLMDLSRIAGVAVFRDRGTMPGNFEVEQILLRR
jgi:VanZ family protein